jgi:hypothetical protein
MSAWQALNGVIEMLSAIPTAVLPAGNASLVRPVAIDDLPTIIVTAEDVSEQSSGVGRLVRNQPKGGPASTASRCAGRLTLELWAADETAMTDLAAATFAALAPTRRALADAGFIRLTVRAIGPIDHAPLGGDTAVLRQSIGCSFDHETVPAVDADGDRRLESVYVEMQDGLNEVMELGAPLTPPVRALIHPPKP